MEVIILFSTFLVLLLIGMPIAFSLGIASLAYLLLEGISLTVVPQRLYAGIDTFVLLCIPGFVLAGNLMNVGNITENIVRFSNALLGHIRGGLGLANVGGSMIFGGISGTAVADSASIGSVMIPGMARSGYDKPFAAAVTAASSTVGPIIPPSVPMIIAGSLSGVSVGRMFLAGAIPGLLLGLAMMVTVYILAVRRGYPKEARVPFLQLLREARTAFWALLMTAIILYGIIGGFFTPTEASIVASLYALVVGMYVYKGLTWRKLPAILTDTVFTSAALLLMVGLANLFGWILTSEQIPQMIAGLILTISENPLVVILILNLILLFVGTFMETIAALIILFPALLGVATGVGMDPVHFAVMAVLNLMIGLTTPPVGVCLFVVSGIGKLPMLTVARAILPFLFCNLMVLLLVAYVPSISLWLPDLILGQ
ncbi:TRAP transporter large permease [Halomonas elongata]|uniref:TRAP transporter large permease protein n=2 Tax=Halomonas elongata TaxID=2746 RepID=E1V4Y4_HALED|nr:TRAP transporter large permease [Halomonas elongata]MBW5800486.1 TRAP transporter large permease [Halomonas elongata]MDL4861128.1 TRAP transporter large permease [Halomonas elongata]OBX35118.1 sialic acid TRAP transporter permease protein SiaT [Halomonas elongata]RAW08453.1 TRAP transporter large permease [Halomonas elongata]WPU47123.1 TRAP transporter large permease [Halomonas elongata DSM 2581]